MSCGIGCRCGSDLALLWLWRSWVATALIRPLAWESPYASGEVLKRQKKKKKKKKNPTTVALVIAEAKVRSPARYSELKEPASRQLRCRSQPKLGFNP